MDRLSANLFRITQSVFAIVGPEGATNFGIVKGADGTALLVDADIRRIDEIEHALHISGCAEVRYLFNTHENFDHSSANYYFEKQGAQVIASDGCWSALKEDGEAKFGEMSSRETDLWKRFPDMRMALPEISFGQTATVYLPGIAVRLVCYARDGRCHSRGDAVAFLDEEGIVFAGDLLYTEVHPVTIYGRIPGWLKAIDELRAQSFKWVVPGHGPIVDGEEAGKNAFLKFRNYLEDFYRQLLEASGGRKTAEEVQAYMLSGQYAHLGKTWMVKRNIDYFLGRCGHEAILS